MRLDGVAIPRGNRSVQRLHGCRSDARFQQGKVSKHRLTEDSKPVCLRSRGWSRISRGMRDAERDGHQPIEQPCYNVAESLLGFRTVHPRCPLFPSWRRRFTARRSTAERVFQHPDIPSRRIAELPVTKRLPAGVAAQDTPYFSCPPRFDSGQSGADRLGECLLNAPVEEGAVGRPDRVRVQVYVGEYLLAQAA